MICGSQDAIDEVLLYLKSNSTITVDKATEFVGMEIECDRAKRTLKVSQPSYIAKVITKFGMENANLSSVSAKPRLHLSKSHVCNDKNDCTPYREFVGSLLFQSMSSRY